MCLLTTLVPTTKAVFCICRFVNLVGSTMPQFRWPELSNDLSLAKEVASARPTKSADWEKIAEKLSILFSTIEKLVELKGRGCRERLDRLLDKFKTEDAKSLKRLADCFSLQFFGSFAIIDNHCRSGTEEDYGELTQLLEDISTYRRDVLTALNKAKQEKKQKEQDDKAKGEEMTGRHGDYGP